MYWLLSMVSASKFRRVDIVFLLVMQDSYMRNFMRFTDLSSKSVLTYSFS